MKLEEVKHLKKTESVCGMLQLQTAIQGVTGGKDVFLPYYLPLEAYKAKLILEATFFIIIFTYLK